MKSMTLFLAILAAVSLAAAGRAEDTGLSPQAGRRISSEYELAKNPSFYFLLDVRGKKIELRARGMVLKSWAIRSMRFWGRPDFSKTVVLVRKSTLKAPQRIIIKPGGTEPAEPGTPAKAGEFDLEAVELKDMPTDFALDFDSGLHVSVVSSGQRTSGFFGGLRRAWTWYVSIPVRGLLGNRKGRTSSRLELTFADGKDAQSIYWHFFDGIRGLVL